MYYFCGVNTTLIVILLIGIPIVGFLFYAGIKGFKTYHFPTKDERNAQYRELKAKAHELYLQREAEKAERKRLKKELKKYGGHSTIPCMDSDSYIMDVIQGKC